MPPPPDLSSYILPIDTAKEIFNTEILPAEFTSLQPSPLTDSQPPLAVLIVGQTGAGKTRHAPPILSALTSVRRAPPAHFIADTYKTYHPSYQKLASGPSPAHASPATGPDARRWLLMAAHHAASLRLDVLLESACRHPDDFAQLAAAFHAAAYRVEVVVLAVPRALSRLGILTRFYERLPEAGSRGLPVRLTPTKVHDDSYEGLLQAAQWIDRNGEKVGQVLVVRRGNLVAFSDERAGDGEVLGGLVAEAITRERERPLTEVEARIARDDLSRLEAVDADKAAEVRDMIDSLLPSAPEGVEYPPLRPLEFPPDSTNRQAMLMLGTSAPNL
ncbi:zeta toxin family protein [Plectosphaerella plurivora]|uniref:Zeta toxin family protein n=1 Tax=Plectosphaerella plurivora TaxID=936078 RepID=A0A9P8VJS7_9PEZI|nr:zeta toxin family protein [Plectosphaerella plurivora]